MARREGGCNLDEFSIKNLLFLGYYKVFVSALCSPDMAMSYKECLGCV